jgi:hypothetical protein
MDGIGDWGGYPTERPDNGRRDAARRAVKIAFDPASSRNEVTPIFDQNEPAPVQITVKILAPTPMTQYC